MKTPEHAVSIDEYIRLQSTDLTADDLRTLRRFAEALEKKKHDAITQGQRELVHGIDVLSAVLFSSSVTDANDPLPLHLAEAGTALRYVLKGIDLIPDALPGIGLEDDTWIVTRVLQRNPGLSAMTD